MKKTTAPAGTRVAKAAAPAPKAAKHARAAKAANAATGKALVTKAAFVAAAGADSAVLLSDLRSLVQSARQRLATVANATYRLLCWQIGHRLLRDSLQGGRAAYGKQILATVSQELTAEFGAGFNYTALTRMARFAEWMTDEGILATLSQTLSWSHFVGLLQWYFGMKAHVGVDAESGLVHTVRGTAGSVNDMVVANSLLHGEETVVFADAGYQGAAKRPGARKDVRWHIACVQASASN